jgi:oligoribonuclease
MQKYLWVDMEMTGLDVEKEVPIEIAAIVADLDFKEYETYHAVIRQPKEILDRMDEWNTKHHSESGLTAQVLEGIPIETVERDLELLMARNFHEPAVLAGNSIGQDRLFINRYMPKFAAKLHYRMLDVTSWKIVMNAKYSRKYDKKNNHRAIDDIRESMKEMEFYLQFVEKK